MERAPSSANLVMDNAAINNKLVLSNALGGYSLMDGAERSGRGDQEGALVPEARTRNPRLAFRENLKFFSHV